MFGGVVTSLLELDDLRESCFNKCEGEPCVGGLHGCFVVPVQLLRSAHQDYPVLKIRVVSYSKFSSIQESGLHVYWRVTGREARVFYNQILGGVI